jgi:hypothetical protein
MSKAGDHRRDNVRLRLFNLEEPAMDEFKIRPVPRPWNKRKLVGQKPLSNSRKFGLSASGFKSSGANSDAIRPGIPI